VSTLKRLGSSKKALATQSFALLVFVGFAILFRRGTQIREQLDVQKSSQIVRESGLMWDPRLPATSEADAVESPKDSSTATIAGEESAPQEATRSESDPAATPKKQAGTPLPVDHEAAARALLEEEEADASVASVGKKKRRKRGKRSGAAVKAKANGAAVANGEDESGSEDEKEAAAAKDTNGKGEEQGFRPTGASPELQSADKALQKQEIASDLSPAVAVAAAAAMPGPTTSTSALEISDEVLGYGSSGTVVFKGKFQSRLVAVKRLLVDFVHLASQEISLLESADDHPNVIRYFYKEQKANFLFIALELCPASLADVVERPDEWKDLAVRLEPKKAIAQIASGLRHLHGLSIVHRDIKPQNILVTYKDPHQPSTSALKMLLSDFGLSKRLDSVAQSSFSQTMHHPGGTAGWRAPEILSGEVSLDEGGSSASTSTSTSIAGPTSQRSAAPRMRLTRGVDIFALGCVTYYLLTSGDHPFGARYEREVNILRNQKNLSRLGAFGEEGVEASHLIAAMIDCDPTKRPRAIQVLAHPYFWDAGKRLAFLQDVSDRLEVIDREKDRASAQQLASNLVANGMAGGGAGSSSSRDSVLGLPSSSTTSALAVAESELIRQLEVGAKEVTAGGDWTKKVDKAFMDDLGKWRKYHGGSVRDLLRALRNKVNPV
jgi:serine/threonine-protein kinase/endoribonuclease IRE1